MLEFRRYMGLLLGPKWVPIDMDYFEFVRSVRFLHAHGSQVLAICQGHTNDSLDLFMTPLAEIITASSSVEEGQHRFNPSEFRRKLK